MMISIITAIHNQLPMNILFWKFLRKYTEGVFELIIIDNGSTDGSREFFQSLSKDYPVTVIVNNGNYSYPYCQNQGIEIARYDILAFLNNDILLPPGWNTKISSIIGVNGFDVLSLGGTDRILDLKTSKKIQRKWKRIKYPLRALFDQRLFALRLMSYLCFGNWEKYCKNIYSKYGNTLTYGFCGSAIIMNRKALDKLGNWDLSQQGADFDLMTRTIKRHITHKDIKPCAVVNGIFHHHFRRVSANITFPPFEDKDNLIPIETKWEKEHEYLQKCFDIVKFKDMECGFKIETAPDINL